MAIRVRPGSAEAIVANPDRFAVEVEGADDTAAALTALGMVRTELVGLSVGTPGGRRPEISPAVLGPGGPLLLVEHLGAPPSALDYVPELVVARLREAGVDDGVVGTPELAGPLDGLSEVAGCVVLRLFPPSGTKVPARWLDLAVDWIVADLDAQAPVATRVLAVEHRAAAGSVAELLHDCGVARAWCDVVTGDLTDRLRSASLTFGRLPHLALAAGGPGVDRSGLLARFELLQELAREVAADVAYACLDVEPTFADIGAGLPANGWRALGGASPNRVAAAALDQLVPDAYPWQLIGAGPAARLVASGDAPAWRDAGGGRVEVALGDPGAWLPDSMERVEAHEIGVDWLSPVLADDAELDRLIGDDAAASVPVADDGAATDGVPDVRSVTLVPTPSARRSTRLTAMELVAWLGHEHHTDAPATASPVLGTFVRLWAAGLDDAVRQRLKPGLDRLVGTAGDAADDDRRRWAMVDWLARVHVPAWLRAAGPLGADVARQLGDIGPLSDRGELAEAVGVLAAYLTSPQRPDDADDRASWDAWESVRDTAAWSATSEAAAQGGSVAAADAADEVVLDAARRSGGATGLPAEQLVEDAWQAALQAVAADGWEQAWRAADVVARERTGLTIRLEMGRVAKASESDLRCGAELDAAERAALAVVVEAVVGGSRDPWESATLAARASSGGSTWSAVVDGSRDAVGEGVWSEAMVAASETLEAVVTTGADVAARAVAGALAREAAGAAARSIASTAVGSGESAWAEPEDMTKTARDALAVIAAGLVEAAFIFLDEQLPPRR